MHIQYMCVHVSVHASVCGWGRGGVCSTYSCQPLTCLSTFPTESKAPTFAIHVVPEADTDLVSWCQRWTVQPGTVTIVTI